MSALRLFAVLLLSLALAGCTSQVTTPGSDGGSSEDPEALEDARLAEGDSIPIEAMTPSQKREQIADSFPAEVPVPLGSVVRGGSQGDEAWEYAVIVAASPQTLVDWYRDVYTSRSWEIVSDTVAGTADGGSSATARYEITLRKGAAESRVTVAAVGDEARASVILGVGTPVLQTQ